MQKLTAQELYAMWLNAALPERVFPTWENLSNLGKVAFEKLATHINLRFENAIADAVLKEIKNDNTDA